jgi:hypothetical protein
VSDDGEEKLPTSDELPTSADDDNKQEEQPETIIVEEPGGIIVYRRGPDGKLDGGHEFSDEELIPDEAFSDEDLRKAERSKTINLDTIQAVQDILEADKEFQADVNGAEEAEPRVSPAGDDLILHFSQSDLDNFVAHRKAGLAAKSLDWIDRASLALWESTKGEISHQTVTALRESVLEKYASPDSHSKVLSFAVGFLKFLAKTKMEPRYTSFEVYLEMPRAVKERKTVTERIITEDDIENVLGGISRRLNTEEISALKGQLSIRRSSFSAPLRVSEAWRRWKS